MRVRVSESSDGGHGEGCRRPQKNPASCGRPGAMENSRDGKWLFLIRGHDVADVDDAGGLVQVAAHGDGLAFKLAGFDLVVELVSHGVILKHIFAASLYHRSGKRALGRGRSGG